MSFEERELVVQDVEEEAVQEEEEALTEINLGQPGSVPTTSEEQLDPAGSPPQTTSSKGSLGSPQDSLEQDAEATSEVAAEQSEQPVAKDGEETGGNNEEGGWEGVDLGVGESSSGSQQEEPNRPSAAATAAATGAPADPSGATAVQPAQEREDPAGGNSFAAVNLAATVPAAVAALKQPGGGGQAMPGYTSRVMQQLAATASEEDDLTVYRSTDMDAAAQSANEVLHHHHSVGGSGRLADGTPAATAGAAAAVAGGGSVGTAAAERFEIDAAPRAQPQQPSAAEAARAIDAWEQTFKGLLYSDGVDSLGRPVVVINADAVPHNMRSSALIYCKWHLEPVVNKGHYVLVFTAKKARLPSMWIMGAYRSLPRPYRKNVQQIILVRPSGFLKAVLALLRPFVSTKAGRKIKKVESLREISEATGGEVTLQHLGQRFITEVVDKE